MPSCVIKHCRNCSQGQKKEDGVSFHKFPTDPILRDTWASIVRESRQDSFWRPSKYCVICSNHFDDGDIYLSKKGLRLLIKNAKPTKFLFQADQREEIPEIITVNRIATSISPSINNPTGSANITNVIEPAVNDSDIESIFDTPRKSRMRRELRKYKRIKFLTQKKLSTLRQKVCRLKKRNVTLKHVLKELKRKNFINNDEHSLLSENIVATELFHSLYLRGSGRKKLKYSPAIRKFCLTLNFYSPKGYEFVRKTFNTCLPHPKTLAKWYTSVKSEPGFTEEAFCALKKISEVTSYKIICCLMFDEMALRQQKVWDGKRYVGVVDMGDEIRESTTLATQAFVFMLNGINKKFKIPLGYFLTNTLTGDQKSNLVQLCLTKCHEAGVKVVSLTFDGHATNFTTMQLLGCNISNPTKMITTFHHPSDGRNVACFLDPSHVIKLLRNQLESKRELLNQNGQKVDWDYIVKLNKLQENEGLHLANKLSKRHIPFRNQIMKVKLATQTLSRSVAKAMQFCRVDMNLSEFKESQPTEEFIQLMNDMFDIFNTRSRTHFDFKKPIYKGNKDKIFALLDQLQDYINNLQVKHVTKRKVVKDGRSTYIILRYYKKAVEARCKTGFIGSLINISSLKFLYNHLIEEEPILLFLPTYKFSQDHLEIFFGCIRMHGGHNDNPNVKQFKAIYRKLLTHLELRSLDTGNCVPLEKIAILTCSSAIEVINSTRSFHRHEDIDYNVECCPDFRFLKNIPENVDDLAKYLDVPIFNNFRRIIVGYIAGSVVHYMKKKVKCESCLSGLIASNRLDFHKLIGLRNKGGLMFPSVDTFNVCIAGETLIRKMLKENVVIKTENEYSYVISQTMKTFIGNNTIFMKLEEDHQNYGAEHKVNLIKLVLEKYLQIRLHYIAKVETNARSDGKRQYFKKLVQNRGC